MKRILLITLVVCLLAGAAMAQDQGAGATRAAGGSPPVEFSTNPDRAALPAGNGMNGPGAGRVAYTEPPDANAVVPKNVANWALGDLDAMANGGDYLFGKLANNACVLLVSLETDPGLLAGAPVGVYQEGLIAAARGPRWSHMHFDAGPTWVLIEDVDGLEVWGPEDTTDVNFVSFVGEPIVGAAAVRTSVYHNIGGGLNPYITQAQLRVAVGTLGYNGDTTQVDLDGLMVRDRGVAGVWDAPDTVIFSIRASDGWDGGEIVVWPFAGMPNWLNHGGHLWNTAFNVAAHFNVATEEVDAIEATPQLFIPSMTNWGLVVLVALLVLATVTVMYRRRRATAVH